MKSITILFITFFLISACQQKEINSEVVESHEQQIEKEPQEEAETKVSIKACTKESKQCPNGKVVARNSKNNCAFDSCDSAKIIKHPVMCPTDVKECPDGSFVSRDHYNNCKFKDCPDSEQ